jgi:hypothetical protein
VRTLQRLLTALDDEAISVKYSILTDCSEASFSVLRCESGAAFFRTLQGSRLVTTARTEVAAFFFSGSSANMIQNTKFIYFGKNGWRL